MRVTDAFATLKPLLNLLAMEPVYLTLLLRENFSDVFHGHEMPNVSKEFLAQCIMKLIEDEVVSIANVDTMPATSEDIVAMMKKRIGKHDKPHACDEVIQLTQRGGALWEDESSIDWSKFYRQMVEECADVFRIEVTAVSEVGACSFLAGVNFAESNAKVLSFSRVAAPWDPVYWKSLKSGWQIVLELDELSSAASGVTFDRPIVSYLPALPNWWRD